VPFTFEPLALPGAVLIRLQALQDPRGFFMETWRRADFERAGIDRPFVQDNHAHTARRGVLRGLHFQREPHAQAKLVRCVRGAVFDVAVDIRRDSPTFGRHVAVELSEENRLCLYVPRGFAHGYVTLTDASDVLYRVDAEYARDAEGGLAWDDPALGIAWPVDAPVLSERDRAWPRLGGLP
jgi:dTDP-4-dehydrorhamnose 3,5-epimerase